MKGIKTILGIALATTGFGGAIAVGAVSASQNNKVEMAEAATTAGNVIIKDNVGWYEGTGSSQAGKAAVYFYSGSSNNGWSDSFSLKSGTGNVYLASYSLNFAPTNMIVVRLKNSAPTKNPTWGDQAYSNQTKDLSFAEATSMNSWSDGKVVCSQWTLSAQVRSSTVESFGTKATLSTIGLNGSNNPEVSGSVSLAVNEEFKILSGDNVWSGYYGCPSALDSCFEGGSKESRSDQNPNIKCLIAGTYDFYFDTETNRVWLSRQDIVDADGYASYFLANVGCDESGATSPSGWPTVASAYSDLSNDAKDFLYAATGSIEEGADNIARCVYWYDYAVRAHSELTKFMVNRSGTPRASSNTIVFANNSNNSAIILIVVITSSIAIISTGAFFLLRKKKHN